MSKRTPGCIAQAWGYASVACTWHTRYPASAAASVISCSHLRCWVLAGSCGCVQSHFIRSCIRVRGRSSRHAVSDHAPSAARRQQLSVSLRHSGNIILLAARAPCFVLHRSLRALRAQQQLVLACGTNQQVASFMSRRLRRWAFHRHEDLLQEQPDSGRG
jgi:hypothetical protein